MLRSIVLLVCILLVSRAAADSCSATVTPFERPGSWSAGGIDRNIYDLHVQNTGSCSFSGTLKLTVNIPAGSFVGYSWGWTPETSSITVPTLAAGQSYSGLGFIIEGTAPGASDITVTSFENCNCGSSSGSNTGASTGSSTGTPTSTPAPTTPQYYFQQNPYNTKDSDPSGSASDLHMNVLVLACDSVSSQQLLATLMLDSTGQPYMEINKTTWGDTALPLINADGSGNFYAIVAATNPAACFNSDQITNLYNYQIQYHVRMVILYAFPSTLNGVDVAPALNGVGLAASGNATYVEAAWEKFGATVNKSASIPVSGVYGYPAVVSASSSALAVATPAMMMTFDNATVAGTPYMIASLLQYTTGRQVMEFYIDQATWAFFSVVAAPFWLNFVTRGLYSGARRVVLNPHMDDVFMETTMWLNDLLKEDPGDNITYRITVTDLTAISEWQADRLTRMPINSTFVITFPFNGATVIQHGGYSTDPLYLYAKSIRDQFYWESHTWDHPIMDGMNYTEAFDEWYKNNATALELFDNNLDHAMYNRHSVITPSISGLFTGSALQALADNGMENVCGDNSHKEQAPAFGYHGWYTNVTSNGYDGIYVVPRHATNIYFDTCNITQIITQYNWLYNRTFNFEQIIEAEITANVVNLLSFRHDPFMFHQANMRQIEYNGKLTSLLGIWIEAIVDATMQYSTLPFWSMKHEELANQLHLREARDRCGFQARLHVSNGKITGFYGESTQQCTFGVTTPVTSQYSGSLPSSITRDYMIDHNTYWLPMSASTPVTFNFDNSIDLTAGW